MSQEKTIPNELRRKLVIWGPPAIAAVALPVHAQMSEDVEAMSCEEAAPIVSVPSPSKCSGDPVIGDALIQINSDNADVDIVITAITFSGESSTDIVSLPSLPATASATVPVDIQWMGPASDALTCLPLNTIEFTVAYSCNDNSAENDFTFNLTTELSAAT